MLVDGVWSEADDKVGNRRFVRAAAAFRGWLTADGGSTPEVQEVWLAEPGRYRLYISRSCPWAHRALIVRALKGLEEVLPVTATHWLLAEHGWTFGGDGDADPELGAAALHQLYAAARPGYTGRVTVPILWDRKRETIVSNESADIVRMLNNAFAAHGAAPLDLYPAALRSQIDMLNERIYADLNNGVYRAGFTFSQDAYDEAVAAVFETLDWLEARLAGQRFLTGDALTEADVRLFPTLIRFDAVYNGHFKCNLRRLADYPALSAYTRDIYQWPGIAATVDFDQIRKGYYRSHLKINPTGIMPIGPIRNFGAPHDRAALAGAAASRRPLAG